ncbi:glycosyltransferase [Kangiella sp.]|uniref:glycosyltransferase n=1 Tax=Gammaproteobacteria TaxID=1236 RepID=UPI003A8EDC96
MIISVCMAVYNGERFLNQQITSILSDLQTIDQDFEIVIIDDCSSDNSVSLIRSFDDPRIKIICNKQNLGHVKTFERAILESTGRFVFLSDQDDIWLPGRASKMLEGLIASKASVLFSEFNYINSNDKLIPHLHCKLHYYSSRFNNILRIMLGKANYWGCACVFDRELLKTAFPFYKGLESHDLWLAFNGSLLGKITHLHEATLSHRLHSSNVTPKKKRAIYKVLKTRFSFLFGFALFYYRSLKRSRT